MARLDDPSCGSLSCRQLLAQTTDITVEACQFLAGLGGHAVFDASIALGLIAMGLVARRRAARQSATAPRGLRRRGSTWTTRCAVSLQPRELGAAALGRRGCRPVRQRLPPHG